MKSYAKNVFIMNDIDVICVGVMVADILASPVDEHVFDRDMTRVESVKLATGGDALNQAFNLSAMGYKVQMAGKVGSDSVGSFLISQAQAKNIDTSAIRIVPDIPTSTTIVLIRENGERNFIGCAKGTNSSIKAVDISTESFANAKIVSLGSLYGSISLTGEEAAPIIQKAKEKNCITVADMMHGDRGSMDDASKVLKNVDYFLPNEKEASQLVGKNDINEIADALLSAGTKTVVIKRGANGCFFKTATQSGTVPAFNVENVVDTTGAGDSFVSGFISGLLDDCSLVDCIKRGNAAGSLTVQQIGAAGAIESKQQLIDICSNL